MIRRRAWAVALVLGAIGLTAPVMGGGSDEHT